MHTCLHSVNHCYVIEFSVFKQIFCTILFSLILSLVFISSFNVFTIIYPWSDFVLSRLQVYNSKYYKLSVGDDTCNAPNDKCSSEEEILLSQQYEAEC